MKTIKTIGLTLLLSICLSGNIFAIGPVTAETGVVPGLLSFAVDHVFSMLRSEDCPLRQCQDCRPNNGTDDDGNGNCRPQ